MKKLLLLLCFGILVSLAGNPAYNETIYIPFSLVYRPYEPLYQAQSYIESSNRDSALNIKEQAFGRMQIRAIRLKDYNDRTGKSYTLQDCYNEKISKEIWLYYATKFHPSDYEGISKGWNGRGKSNKIYWNKVKKRLKYLEMKEL